MIACEKAALEGIFAGVVDEFGASLWTLRGFNSESFDFEWSEAIQEITSTGRHVEIAYFGDFDPSGLEIERSSRRKLEGFGARFGWRRAGLLLEDFEAFDLARIPVKRHTDTRAKAFLSKFGDCAAELDALPPAELEHRIRSEIEALIDGARWQRVRQAEQAEREALRLVADNWDVALGAVGGAA